MMALSRQIASISTISAHRGKYDVFLSFRGETRRTFTDHLCKALKDKGLNVFRDHELERGTDLPSMLSNAIKESRFAIIVLSPDYASSTWCLQELSKVFEEMKDWKTIQRIIPIFYNVEPSDVRKQRGTYHESFKKHEENFIPHKKLQQWRTALTEVSGITGWNSKIWDYETDFIAKIAEAVYIKLVCACCNMRIDDEEVYFSCMGAVWHRECFRCNACNLPFTGNEFWECGDHPYHKSCYKVRFDVCKSFILENSGGHSECMKHLTEYRSCHEGNETLKCSSYETLKPRDTGHGLLDYQKHSVVPQDIKFSYQKPGSNSQTTELTGTFGYLTPEYLGTGKAREEADAYSYGVVASEITTATKDFSNEIKSETLLAPVLVANTKIVTSLKEDSGARGPGVRRFSDLDAAIATNNSPRKVKLGEGGFGSVYRSFSASLKIAAEKNISRRFKKATKESAAKVKASSLRHENLLQLIGWFLLLYMFMPNGVLDFRSGSSLLNCRTCLISMILAFALLYFSERGKKLVVHCSINISNLHRILLGSSFKYFNLMPDGILYSHLSSEISSLLAVTFVIVSVGCSYQILPQFVGWLQGCVADQDSKSNNILLDSIFKGKFMQNGSVDSQIFFGKSPSLLDYAVRLFISMGSASALFYLDQRWKQSVVQRLWYNEISSINSVNCNLSMLDALLQAYAYINGFTLDAGTLASHLYEKIYPRLAWGSYNGYDYVWIYIYDDVCWTKFVVHWGIKSSSEVQAMLNAILGSLHDEEVCRVLVYECTCILYLWRQFGRHRDIKRTEGLQSTVGQLYIPRAGHVNGMKDGVKLTIQVNKTKKV